MKVLKEEIRILRVLLIIVCISGYVLPAEDSDMQRLRERMTTCERLVHEGEKILLKNPLSTACRIFETESWNAEGLTVSVFGLHERAAVCYLDGLDTRFIWDFLGGLGQGDSKKFGARGKKNSYFDSDELERKKTQDYIIDEMVSRGRKGGWISYEWNGGVRFSFVKLVKKANQDIVFGVGFYPDSPQFIIQQLVQQAVWYGKKYGAADLFQQINNPQGPFVFGDMYLWAYDFDGFAFAHGRNLAYVGQNRLDWRDSRGRERNRLMIDLVGREGKGWVEYDENGLAKRAYVKELVDPRNGQRYVVGGGYYPDITANTVRDMVKKGVAYLKANGPEIAFRDFTSYVGQFAYGPLHMFAYDLDGISRADGENPIFIGQNLLNIRDSEGRYVVQEMLDVAKNSGSGWINFINKRSFYSVYVELVEVPDGKFVIGSGYWPVSKESYASLLCIKAARSLETLDIFEAFSEFSSNAREFVYGELFVQVYAEDGTCLVYGMDKQKIWDNVSEELDEYGYPFVDRVIAVAKQGGGWVRLKRNGHDYKIYGLLVKKEEKKSVQASAKVPEGLLLVDGLKKQGLVEAPEEDKESLIFKDGESKSDQWLKKEGFVGHDEQLKGISQEKELAVVSNSLKYAEKFLASEEKNKKDSDERLGVSAVDRNFIVAVGFYE